MGCGSSTGAGADGRVMHAGGAAVAEELGNPALAVLETTVAKRMESKYPWEDMEPVPEDTTVIFVLGGPGSGKSTQCQKMVELYGYTHLVTGDLLRAEVDSGTAMGKWAHNLMQQGKLVPNQLSITLLKRAMISATNPIMIVDGFPRSVDQIGLFERGICKCHAVIFFDISEDAAKSRRINAGDSETLHKVYQTFVEQSLPVKDHYVAQGKCHVIDAERSPEEIFKDVQAIVEQLEQRRRKELDEEAALEARRRERADGEEDEEEEEEEEDASYNFVVPSHVPAEHYNAGRGVPVAEGAATAIVAVA